MKHYDVFNGDADGICGLLQLRLHHPLKSKLITGVKRNIYLLKEIDFVRDSQVTVLDISLDSNREALLQLLDQQNSIIYFDHHFSGEIPASPYLEAYIDTSPEVCTSLLVDRYLQGKYRPWAITAAFGDNLHSVAYQLAKLENLSSEQTEDLRELGELINYNGYGSTLKDLYFHPAQLYEAMLSVGDPWIFSHESKVLSQLKEGYLQDMEKAKAQIPLAQTQAGVVHCFPAEPWGKRVAGVFSNEQARQERSIAHALLVENGDGSYLVSVRAPLEKPHGADVLCNQFYTGGGRAAAAGVNQLPESELERFLKAFDEVFALR